MKNLLKVLFSFIFFLVLAVPVFSQTTPLSSDLNSFEIFWPVAAGKTVGEPLYKLKLFKEKVRGMLIFGDIQKADYALFLSTKRLVEAEKLINLNQVDSAKQTISAMYDQLKVVSENVSNKEGADKEDIDEINIKLEKLEMFVGWLASRNEEYKDQLMEVLNELFM